MLSRNHPDRIQITFDDRRLVANAGLLLPATLARHLGLPELVQQRLDLGDAPGRANAGDKMMTLVASALAGGDCIDDADVLRTGGTACTLGGTVKAPSTLGTFLRSFRWGHVRQLDRVSRELLARAWQAGAGPGDGPLTIDLDSTICETYGLAKEGARHHGYTGKRGYHPLLAIAAGTGDVLMSRLREGQQRVIAPGAGVAVVAGALLGQAVGLADGRIEVDGKWRVAGSGSGLPCLCQQLAAHPVQLADVAPAKAAQEDAQGGWRLDFAAESAGRPASAQRIGVVDAVAASQRGSDQRHYLVAGVGPARRIAQVQALLYQLGKAEVQGQGGWKEQAGVGHQAVVVEGDLDAVGVVAWQHLLGAPSLGSVLCFENHYPRFWGAPFCFFRRSLTRARSVDWGLGPNWVPTDNAV